MHFFLMAEITADLTNTGVGDYCLFTNAARFHSYSLP